mmetsp:Transcript_29147/g.46809  ORF Transcript_29147/g.46809 Transcript_29147/m.46809 type:complete len:497 (+) Transcript_29147:144-1634(+)
MAAFTTVKVLLLALPHLFVLGEAKSNGVRGVDPKDLALYTEKTFKCIDGSMEIESWKVNDDYCDCEDGSDEPGTSACSLGQFYCINKGFEAKTVPSSRVNDGICDCCDGSDEWGASVVRCEDTCIAEAREAYQEQIEQLDTFRQGLQARKKLEEEGAQIIAQKESEKADARSKMSQAEKSVSDLKAKVDALQAVVDAQSTSTENGEVGTASVDGAGEQGEGDAANNLEQGEGEEEASFPYPKEYAAPDSSSNSDDGAQGEQGEEKFPYPKEYAAPPSGGDDGEAGGEEEKFPYPKEYAAPSAGGDEGGSAAAVELATKSEEGGEDGSGDGADGESEEDTTTPEMKELEETRQKLRDAEAEVRDLKKRLEATDKYPSNAALVALYEKCFEKTVRQYTYEVCLFKDSYQKEGSSRTRLGNFDAYDEATKKMSFKNGQTCWNGPARSLTVSLECGAETVLGSVDEPSKCVYATTLKTPVVCDPDEAKKLEDIVQAIQRG